MNIIENEMPYLVEARTCGCNERGKNVSYRFIESSHGLCMDKIELISGQIQACERLLKLAKEDGEIVLLRDEISKLKLALDLIQQK
ncbi:MAG TPA: hypothetical protein VJL78_01235 [Candidatus Nitrosocosmicus sp.]|jgi:hypothetical protein|nr:hypothetical protein [Candidatus Nitrosocosmicus sp.]